MNQPVETNLRTYERSVGIYDKDTLRQGEERVLSLLHGRVLDLGCGTGRTTGHIAKTCDVIGIDYSPAMIRRAQERYPHIDFRVMNAVRLDLPDASFDSAYFSFNGLDYLYPLDERIGAFRQIRRVLKPGGLFMYSSHVKLGRPVSLGAVARRMYGWIHKIANGIESPYFSSSTINGILVTYCDSFSEQLQLLSDTGFMLEDFFYVKGDTEMLFIARTRP